MREEALIAKYDVPVPRYTSYPTVPAWNTEAFSLGQWKDGLNQCQISGAAEGLALYIHLPYCEQLCTYCGCNKRITVNHNVELPYIQAIVKEWLNYLKYLGEKPVIREIHLGGGTPTFFSAQHLELMIQSILSHAEVHERHEFSFEGHPNNTTYEHLEVLYQSGFRRVSFGIQDFDPKVQKVINRIQPSANVEQVTRWAREIGYTSVNYDLVYGLPFQTSEGIRNTMDFIDRFRPDRIAFYSYAHVPWNSPGQRAYSEKDLPSGEEKRALNVLGQELLKKLGYVSMGMDHFALPSDDLTIAAQAGEMKRNFMGYTVSNTQALVGLGVSAISEIEMGYAQNVKSVEDYLEKVGSGQFPIFKGHIKTKNEQSIKAIIMKIACTRKIPMASVAALQHNAKARFDQMVEEGLLEHDCAQYVVTEKGTQFLRNICALFDEYYFPDQSKNVFSKSI